jgi:hypothetical protein
MQRAGAILVLFHDSVAENGAASQKYENKLYFSLIDLSKKA